MKQKDRKVWYERGFRFECTRCGACCRGEEGYVWVTDADIKRMARALGMDAGGFRDPSGLRVRPVTRVPRRGAVR